MPSAEAITPPMDWEEAGRAWGARPTDWAYLLEPYARPANEVIFDQLGVGDGTRLLDIACGSGFAAQLAARRGAAVTGIDASDALVRIARARTAEGDFRLGDMFALPFPDACFDVATSFNGIWKGCEAALREAARVLVPGGRLGLTFWGRLDHVGLMPYFLKIIELSPPSHAEANIRQGHTGQPGVIEEMLVSAGFMPRERGTVTVINEWPDAGLAVRALAAAGPSIPAIQAAGFGPFCEALREVIEPLHTPDAGIRIASEFGWITAELRPVDSLPRCCTTAIVGPPVLGTAPQDGGRPSAVHRCAHRRPLTARRDPGLQPESRAGITSARLLTPRNRFRAVMASPQIKTIGTTYARNGQGPHLIRMRRISRVFPGSGSVSNMLSLSSPNMPSRGLSRSRAGSRYRRWVSVNRTHDLPGSACRTT